MGDICLVPSFSYALLVLPKYGVENFLVKYPVVSQWWNWVMSDDTIATTDNEMKEAFLGFMAAAAG